VAEHVFRADTTPRDDTSGTPFEALEVRTFISSAHNSAELSTVGQTIYPKGRHGHEAHFHPNAEETLIVLGGTGRYQVGDDVFDIGGGDIVFVPKGVVHATSSGDADDLVTIWVLGGAGSLDTAGYVSAADQGRL
jgi:quercetin dioxygenase-like cupin family protein